MGRFAYISLPNLNNHLAAHQEPNYFVREHLLNQTPLYCCHICYPLSTSEDLSIQFQNFWNWISYHYLAQSYTSATLYLFENSLIPQHNFELHSTVKSLLESIIFEHKPTTFQDLFWQTTSHQSYSDNWSLQVLQEEEELTQTRFENDLFETTPSETSTSSSTRSTVNTPQLDTMDAVTNNLLQALQDIQLSLNRRPIANLPEFKGNFQDPNG
jgi:hypothetical protein